MSRPKPSVNKALSAEISSGQRLLLAVSGGVDSVVLLHGCLALRRRLSLTLEVAHVDHRLRPESLREAEFVRSLAENAGIPFHLKVAESPPVNANLEAWGRRVRYTFFRKLLRERHLEYVLTAHNANDVAETLLMRLVANKELKSISRRDEVRHCIRPYLSLTREVIQSYATHHALAFVEDRSNQDERFLRNKIRHRLLPLLAREFDSRIVEVLSHRGQVLADDLAFMYSLIRPAATRLAAEPFGTKVWLRAVRSELQAMPKQLRWRLAEELFKSRLGFNLGRSKSEMLVRFLEGHSVGLQLPGGLHVRAKGGGVLVEQQLTAG